MKLQQKHSLTPYPFSKKSSKGFTLIELLVVIAIIGLLASIVLASLNGARKKSRDARRQADLSQLATSLELYANDSNGTYPVQTSQGALPSALVPGAIVVLPTDPLGASAQAYQYKSNAAGTAYCLGAFLEGSTLPTPASTCSTVTLSAVVNYSRGN
ncbi:MAG: prepilin-type N-terminal cleavage/methylation domain-containing protein [bacterium]|nr:prepilin-type N-terminal cleavage/methylation domain-containing protein [bacterium]